MASYRQLSRVARLVDGLLDLDLLTDAELDSLLECAEDEDLLIQRAHLLAGIDDERSVIGETFEPDMGGQEPRLIQGIVRRGFLVLRGGRA